MQAAGENLQSIQNAKMNLTIEDMLKCIYALGTQRGKKIPPSPSVKSLQPICNLDFSSLSTKVKKMKTRITKKNKIPATHFNVSCYERGWE